jgi:single-strand DNA-binding protein
MLMPARTAPRTPAAGNLDDTEAVNEILLRGRLAAVPDERDLPSGDTVLTFRLVVDRPPRAAGRGSGSPVRVDTLDCAAFAPTLRRRLRGWQPGDVLEIRGSLRRRFFRTGGGPASRYEVEVGAASRVAKAPG